MTDPVREPQAPSRRPSRRPKTEDRRRSARDSRRTLARRRRRPALRGSRGGQDGVRPRHGRGIGANPEDVSSPTFTIVQEYAGAALDAVSRRSLSPRAGGDRRPRPRRSRRCRRRRRDRVGGAVDADGPTMRSRSRWKTRRRAATHYRRGHVTKPELTPGERPLFTR